VSTPEGGGQRSRFSAKIGNRGLRGFDRFALFPEWSSASARLWPIRRPLPITWSPSSAPNRAWPRAYADREFGGIHTSGKRLTDFAAITRLGHQMVHADRDVLCHAANEERSILAVDAQPMTNCGAEAHLPFDLPDRRPAHKVNATRPS